MKKTPVITVTCCRDLPLLDLQAQGVQLYLNKSTPVYLIVNEADPASWFKHFDQHIRHRYSSHQLTILTRDDFTAEWSQWIPSNVNPWSVGWETQQILKFAIATYLDSPQYLILDSQNFLFKQWDSDQYNTDHRTPARSGHFTMPLEIWNDYSKGLAIAVDIPSEQTMSMCTPIFFRTDLVKSLIESKKDVYEFTKWFKNVSRIKSEFILYLLWTECQGGLNKFHNMIPVQNDWASPYLRDCKSEESFNDFFNFVGVHAPHSWISVNHRAWGNMTLDQYNRLCSKLMQYNLTPNFDQYRKEYIDLKF
jgi:hypothetical protein